MPAKQNGLHLTKDYTDMAQQTISLQCILHKTQSGYHMLQLLFDVLVNNLLCTINTLCWPSVGKNVKWALCMVLIYIICLSQ